VSRKLHGGEFSRAVQECDRVIEAHPGDDEIRGRAVSLQRNIPVFATNYEDGLLKLRSGASAAAARPLRKARELLLQMGLPGPLSVQLDALLAQTATAAGKHALQRNDLSTAFSAFNEALRLNGGDADAREGLEQVRGRAQQIYFEAYQVRDRDPSTALKKFRLVKQIAPPGSELAEKAHSYLVELEP
jgi:tetratricopeptide (TPR) repeat protein